MQKERGSSEKTIVTITNEGNEDVTIAVEMPIGADDKVPSPTLAYNKAPQSTDDNKPTEVINDSKTSDALDEAKPVDEWGDTEPSDALDNPKMDMSIVSFEDMVDRPKDDKAATDDKLTDIKENIEKDESLPSVDMQL